MSTLITEDGKVASGLPIDSRGLEDLYGPRQVEPYTPPPSGIDNLGITATDTFQVPGKGEFVVDFTGFVRVSRTEPTSDNWTEAEVFTNLVEMRMVGRAEGIGRIIVSLNPDFLSTGQLGTPFEDLDKERPEKACRMAVGIEFSLPDLGLTLYNKEPVVLTIDNVQAIPPAGNPGIGRIYKMLPLFNRADPDGPPTAYLTALKFAIGYYLTEAEVEAMRHQEAIQVQ